MTSHYGSALSSNYRQAGVLIIDDKPEHQAIMQSAIQQVMTKINAVWIPDSIDALAHLDACMTQGQLLPKLILLNLYLPEREDGQELLHTLKKHAVYHRVPVVVLSHSNNPEDCKRHVPGWWQFVHR